MILPGNTCPTATFSTLGATRNGCGSNQGLRDEGPARINKRCEISGLGREMDENCPLLGCYAASSGNCLRTIWDNLLVPPSRVKTSNLRFSACWLVLRFSLKSGVILKYTQISVPPHREHIL
jgi:hypothetical protein